jgi:RimJ/RimL family protein N-acetyltransferase
VAEPIGTPRLRLEPLTAAVADEMAAVLADPALYRFTGGSPPALEELRRRYAVQATGRSPDGSQGWLNWIVRHGTTGRALGFVQATVEEAPGGQVAELAWVIEVRAQGHGFAAEAAAAMLDWLRRRGVGTVTAHIHPDHAASMRVAARLGLTPTGVVVDGEQRWAAAPGVPVGR